MTNSYKAGMAESLPGAPVTRVGCDSRDFSADGQFKIADVLTLPIPAAILPARPLADIFHPPYLPTTSQSISRDVPLARARAFQFYLPLFRGVAKAAFDCVHRVPTATSWGLCEQEGHLAAPSPSLHLRSLLS